MSEIVANAIKEFTPNNGVTIDGIGHKKGIRTHSSDVGSITIPSTDNSYIMGPANITGTVNIDGHMEVL
jgi:hypothetical protein